MITVHALWGGFPLCGFSEEIPQKWPKGHVWHPTPQWPPDSVELKKKQAEVCKDCDNILINRIFRSPRLKG